MRVVKVDGATLREWLERSAGLFRRIDPASIVEQPLIDPAFAAYNFDVIDGVTYAIDVTQPSRYDVGRRAGRAAGPAHRRSPVSRASRSTRRRPSSSSPIIIAPMAAAISPVATDRRSCSKRPTPIAKRWCAISSKTAMSNRRPTAIGASRHGRETSSRHSRPRPLPPAPPRPIGVKLTPMGDAPGGFVKYRIELA